MTVGDITKYLESIAPSAFQEGYDNSGLIVGQKDMEVTGAVICLDSTEQVIEEAIAKKCNLVIAHHPIVFKGLKRFNGRNYVERTIIKAIKNDIAIYAIHTNLDNVFRKGVNAKIAKKLGLVNTQILAPKQNLLKLFCFVPTDKSDVLRAKFFEANAGVVGETNNLSYATLGVGTQSGSGSGQVKLEVVFEAQRKNQLIQLLHENLSPDEVVYDIVKTENQNPHVGSGMVGDLAKAMAPLQFLKKLKESMRADCVKYTRLPEGNVKRIAVCGGSGGFLLRNAISAKADVFITADYKYHEYFDADGQILIADIGHYESEQFTINLIFDILSKKFPTFAPASAETRLFKTEINTNPVNYL